MLDRTARRRVQATPVTVADVLDRYRRSEQHFGRLAPGTQRIHRSHLRRFAAVHGTLPFADLTPSLITVYLDPLGPHVARSAFKVIRALCRYGVAMGWRCDDPTKLLTAPKIKAGGGHRLWTNAELKRFADCHGLGSRPFLVFALAYFTAQRRSDIVKMRQADLRDDPDPVDNPSGKLLYVKQAKTKSELLLPVHPHLLRTIAASPCGTDTFVVTKSGGRFSENDLSDEWRVWCRAAGLPDSCTLHGLRVTALTHMADAGCSAHQLAAVGGHKSLKEVERYTRGVEQVRLAKAAMKAMPSLPAFSVFNGSGGFNGSRFNGQITTPVYFNGFAVVDDSPPSQAVAAKHEVLAAYLKTYADQCLRGSRQFRRVAALIRGPAQPATTTDRPAAESSQRSAALFQAVAYAHALAAALLLLGRRWGRR